MLPFPEIDPVAFTVFGWPVRWYGLAYVAGFIGAVQYLKYLAKLYPNSPIKEYHGENLFTWAVLGVIIGGRLGYVLFYNPEYYFANPADILKTWHGGMSFHGGALGVIFATMLFALKNKIHMFDLTDRLAPATCIGLFFGRIANFINGELFGKVSDVPWAMVFPHGGDLPRHPSQLYEAVLEGIVLFLILNFIARKRLRRYELSGLFLIGYGTFRFFIEFFRMPDAHLQSGIFQYLSMGQILSLPMLAFGVYFWLRSKKYGTNTNRKPTKAENTK